MLRCPKCREHKHVIQKKKKLAGKMYWISICVDCKTIMNVDDIEVVGQ